jgi:hypothetical protein
MRAFAKAYPDEQFVQAVLAQITWYHHITLLDEVKDSTERQSRQLFLNHKTGPRRKTET